MNKFDGISEDQTPSDVFQTTLMFSPMVHLSTHRPTHIGPLPSTCIIDINIRRYKDASDHSKTNNNYWDLQPTIDR